MEYYILQSLPYACVVALLGLLCLIGCVLADSQRNSEASDGRLDMVLIVEFYDEERIKMPVESIEQAQTLLNRINYGAVHDARVWDRKTKRVVHYVNAYGVLV